MSSQPLLRLLRSRAPQIRSFTQTTPFLQAAKRDARPPPPPKLRPAAPAKNVAARFDKSMHPTRPPGPASSAPPVPTSESQKMSTTAGRMLGDAESMLLYKAPRHVSLFMSCTIVGTSLFAWVAEVSHQTFMATAPWYGQLVVLGGCLLSSTIASAVVLTPHHLVKTISIVRMAEGHPMLRVKATRFFPFMKPASFDVVPGKLLVDSNITSAFEKNKPPYCTVPIHSSKAWTQGLLKRPGHEDERLLARMNRGLLNIKPAAFKHVKKMFNREDFVYLQIGKRTWKLDLDGAEVLDHARPLSKLATEGAVRTSLTGLAARALAR